MKKVCVVAGSLALALFAFPVPSRAEDAGALEKLLKEAKLTLAQAVDAGASACKEGVAFHAELEVDGDRIVFSIDVAQGKKTCNASIDAKDGTVVEKSVEDEDHSAAVAGAKVTLKAAIEAALAVEAGLAVEAKLSAAGGKPVFTVRIVNGGGVAVVEIDGVTGASLARRTAPTEPEFTAVFRVDAEGWSSRGTNPWFVLEPGYVLVLEGKDDGEAVVLTITVLDETLEIGGVKTRIVEEREMADGKLKEVSRNYFALSKRSNDVYYFGEDVDMYEGGKVTGHGGSWKSGEKGAKFGLMMPGTPLLGARYHQEVAPGIALDRAEIVSLTETVETPAGSLSDCLRTEESTPLEPGKKEYKSYARGIGLVRDGSLRFVRRVQPK